MVNTGAASAEPVGQIVNASKLLAPSIRETTLGNATILEIFKVSKVGNVAGCRVTEGTVLQREAKKLLADFNRPVFKTWIADRECYKQVMGLGTTVLDTATLTRLRIRGAVPAAKQIRELAQEVIHILP